MSWSLRKYGLYGLVIAIFCLLLTIYTQMFISMRGSVTLQGLLKPEPVSFIPAEKYLVENDKCKIPDLDPWNSEAKAFYVKTYYKKCSHKTKLTQIAYVNNDAFLRINRNAKPQYSGNEIRCCYSNVSRGTGESPDLGISVSPCSPFENEVKLSEVSILVKCKDMKSDEEIYTNTHAILPKTLDVLEKIKMYKGKIKPPSILLIGIDSMSRLNFHRVFPKTKKFLDKNDWIEYKGYNKIGDNTLPNLMALLAGKNLSAVLSECDPREQVDKCNFIWKDFSKLGYITAYAEDEISISTFTTYTYKGFREKPADYYFIPYVMASEKLLTVRKLDGMTYCTGMETSAERILNIAKDMVLGFSAHPKFGFFWMNSFSHDNINAPGRMDKIFAKFFAQLQPHIAHNTIVLFFSDHGIRFGDIRLTRSGWLEERLPFLFFWIPKSLKRGFPDEVQQLTANSVKLTTPYDIYMTLQHVLVLSKLDYVPKPSEACAQCKSLFTYIDNRSCEDVGIRFHWCTCLGYAYVNPRSELVIKGTNFAVDDINRKLDSDIQMRGKCARFTLKTIISAGISDNNLYNKTFLLLMFETMPTAKYEVTVSVSTDEMGQYFVNEGSSSRLDRYESTSGCVRENKMYCYCTWIVQWQLRFNGFWFEI